MKKTTFAILLAITTLAGGNLLAQTTPPAPPDAGWPREHSRDGTRYVVYQPQVDDWKDFQDLTWRMAVAITPKGGKEVIGVVQMKGTTVVDNENKVVLILNPEITATHFPPESQEKATEFMKASIPSSITISLHRLIASVPKAEPPAGVKLNNDPPKIFVGYRPSILLSVDGDPALSEVPDTNLKFVANTQWPVFFDGTNYYAPVGQEWLTATKLDGTWSPTKKLPPDMTKVAQDKEWDALKKIIPPPAKPTGVTPAVFYSDRPAEVILFDGQPVYAKIAGTQLTYATNTDSVVFVNTPTQEFYYLTAGRWFKAADLQGPWTFATQDLPADFAKIPANSPASAVLASVPGTNEAKDAVLLAAVPTTMTINPEEAQSKVNVEYGGGEPKFEPITGTSMAYATNTRDKVIRVGDVYYLCLQGVWFMSPNAQGPWTTAKSVPQEIYTIPADSPVYNVTYVTQSTTPEGTIQSSYTAGYLGAFVLGAATGAIIANGTGYWGAPYVYGGYYYPYPTAYGAAYYAAPHYNYATGAYGWSQTVAGPYGSATRGAGYNPYTGTYARGATASTAYGSRTVAQAYNPYTGAYGATRQGSSPGAQWGQSVVSRNGNTAYTQHYSTANGTVGSIQGSQGGKAVGSSTAWGNSAAAKTANGNMYAGHDGNVYKNTGSGWQSYNNGSWNSVNKPTPNFSQATDRQGSAAASSSYNRSAAATNADRSNAAARSDGGGDRFGEGRSSEMQNMQRESENRFRGGQESDRFSDFQRGGGDRWGGGGGGERFGGGRRR